MEGSMYQGSVEIANEGNSSLVTAEIWGQKYTFITDSVSTKKH